MAVSSANLLMTRQREVRLLKMPLCHLHLYSSYCKNLSSVLGCSETVAQARLASEQKHAVLPKCLIQNLVAHLHLLILIL